MLCQIDTSCLLCQMAIAGLLLLPAVFASCPCQQLLPAASATAPRPAASSRWCSATAPLPAASSRWLFAAAPLPVAAMPRRSLQQHLCYGAPASNKPHPAEKSTLVWLAIWHIWAGFANSQHRDAAFRSTYQHICAHPPCCHIELLLKQTQICRPICTDCLRHLRISAG